MVGNPDITPKRITSGWAVTHPQRAFEMGPMTSNYTSAMGSNGRRANQHPMSRSLNYAIILCIFSSILVGVAICLFVEDFRHGSGTGMVLWACLAALAAAQTISRVLGIRKVVRNLIAESQARTRSR